MCTEERTLYEAIAYAYFISEGMVPESAKRKVEGMTIEELDDFVS